MLGSDTYRHIINGAAKRGMTTAELEAVTLRATGVAVKTLLYDLNEEQGLAVVEALAASGNAQAEFNEPLVPLIDGEYSVPVVEAPNA